MKNRSPLAVALLPLFTFGIYAIYWFVTTKGELKSKGADIPTAWLIIVPIANLYWYWKYAEGVEKASNGQVSTIKVIVLILLLSVVGMAILQSDYNKMGENAAANPPQPGNPPQQPPANPAPQA